MLTPIQQNLTTTAMKTNTLIEVRDAKLPNDIDSIKKL